MKNSLRIKAACVVSQAGVMERASSGRDRERERMAKETEKGILTEMKEWN